MGVYLDQLHREDINRLAALHSMTLPRSMVSRLGRFYARSFYRYLGRSRDELICLQRDPNGSIVAACVLSLAPGSLELRLLLHTSLCVWAALNFPRMPWSDVFSKPSLHNTGPDWEPPELIIIFTDPAHQSTGIGAKLVALCEHALAGRAVPSYQVKTENRSDNRALQFYDRNGFRRIDNVSVHGVDFVLFEKAIVAASHRAVKGAP